MNQPPENTEDKTSLEGVENPPTAGVPDDPLTEHCYDGIREFDNPLPGWWKWLFVATILFAFPYIMYYHGGAEGRSLDDSYQQALAANLQLQFATIGEVSADRRSRQATVPLRHRGNT